ncbi:hypothetical protein RBB79_03315 [Tunturiibacter empetritectus]|uniref:MFS superfamily sulfate permease-like transporter n=1 Tax=Tunturiibacter lichenicola TaxID=2051959 RepID=A0A852VCI6_9BACT|nr:hypothetical protein [Edaphobacter lichenicola]NYF88539.1 MFS superfamily sulfate permease-like transporter [Edaphobacter lichenicola]
MPDIARFFIFMIAAFLLFIAVLLFVTRKRTAIPNPALLLVLATIVVIVGMIFARYSHLWIPTLPWQIYYGLPALLTLTLAPLVLRMSRTELAQYIPMAFLMAPAIHIVFSLLVGWHDYMPFPFYIPSLAEFLIGKNH